MAVSLTFRYKRAIPGAVPETSFNGTRKKQRNFTRASRWSREIIAAEEKILECTLLPACPAEIGSRAVQNLNSSRSNAAN
jgi:hypothetical protein